MVRTTGRTLLLMAVVLLATADAARAQTRTLRGRIVALDRRPLEGVRLRLVGLGDPAVLGSGEFIYEIPAATQAVTVEVQDSTREVVYPVDGRIPVPAGDELITIVIGEPVTRTVTRALAERQLLAEQLLAGYGAQQDAIGGLERGILQVLERLDVRDTELRDEKERLRRQGEVYPTISEVVEKFLLEASDLSGMLALFRQYVESNPRAAFQTLREYVEAYNAAYEKLLLERGALETAVEREWSAGEVARRDLVDLYDDLEQIHRTEILPLNELTVPIQSVLIGGTRRDSRYDGAFQELARRLPDLDRSLAAARIKSARTLEQLRPR
jgi:hypothetical protein